MLVLNARFVLLSAFCSLATVTFSPCWGVGAAAIQSRSYHGHYHNVTPDQPSAQYVLPLPLQSNTKQFKRTHEIARGFRNYQGSAQMARRSVLIPDSHGSKYVVANSKRPVRQRQRRVKARMLNGMAKMSLSKPAQDGIPGFVALMSRDDSDVSDDSATGRQIQVATLYATPNGPDAWTVYASDTNKTQFRLVNTPSVRSTSDLSPVMPVMLVMDTESETGMSETRICATYYPPRDESDTQNSDNMTMETCVDPPESSDKSQIFMHNSTSNTLYPTSYSYFDDPNTTAASSSASDNSTSSSNATAASSAIQAAATLFANRDVSQNSTKRNLTVTLVFQQVKPIVGAEENSNSATGSGTTTTMTKTVTVFNIGSTSTMFSSSTSNAAAQATETSSAMEVQLVGAPNATGTTTIGSASMSTSSSAATRSIDAAAIASQIAAASSASVAASSTTISSSTNSAPLGSGTQAAHRRENGRLVVSDSKINIVSTEPYTWMFKQ